MKEEKLLDLMEAKMAELAGAKAAELLAQCQEIISQRGPGADSQALVNSFLFHTLGTVVTAIEFQQNPDKQKEVIEEIMREHPDLLEGSL